MDFTNKIRGSFQLLLPTSRGKHVKRVCRLLRRKSLSGLLSEVITAHDNSAVTLDAPGMRTDTNH